MVGLVQDPDATDPAVFLGQVGGEFEFADGDVLQRLGLHVQGAADLAAGGVALGVQDTRAAVRTLTGERQLGPGAVEFRSPGNQLLDALGAFLHQHLGRFGVAEAVAGVERVLKVEADFVFVAEGRGNPALGILGVGFRQLAFGEHEHTSGGGELDGGPQTGHTSSHDYEIAIGQGAFHEPGNLTTRHNPAAASAYDMMTPWSGYPSMCRRTLTRH